MYQIYMHQVYVYQLYVYQVYVNIAAEAKPAVDTVLMKTDRKGTDS